MTNQQLSEQLNLSPTPTLRRTRQLEKRGAIKSYAAIVDKKAYGLSITAYIRVRLDTHSANNVRRFEEDIQRAREVLECHLMTGNWDYLLKAVAKDLDHYERFVRSTLQHIPGISAIDSSLIYGTVKETFVFPEV